MVGPLFLVLTALLIASSLRRVQLGKHRLDARFRDEQLRTANLVGSFAREGNAVAFLDETIVEFPASPISS